MLCWPGGVDFPSVPLNDGIWMRIGESVRPRRPADKRPPPYDMRGSVFVRKKVEKRDVEDESERKQNRERAREYESDAKRLEEENMTQPNVVAEAPSPASCTCVFVANNPRTVPINQQNYVLQKDSDLN